MSSITEFAQGSIVSSSSYYTAKNGKRHKTMPQFKFQSRGGRGKQKPRHIPAAHALLGCGRMSRVRSMARTMRLYICSEQMYRIPRCSAP